MYKKQDWIYMSFIAFLDSVERECKIKSVIHSQSAEHYKKINLCLVFPALFISAVCGSSFLVNNSSISDIPYIIKVMTICNMIAWLILVLQNLINFTKKSENHMQTSREYSKIYREIIYFKKKYISFYQHNSTILEIFCDNIHFKQNVVSEVELECPEKVARAIFNEDNDTLSEKYFVAQTKFKKYKYSVSHIKRLLKEEDGILMNIIIAELRKNNLEEKFKYIDLKETTKMQLIDLIVIEINIDPSMIKKCIEQKADHPPLPIINNFMQPETYGFPPNISATQSNMGSVRIHVTQENKQTHIKRNSCGGESIQSSDATASIDHLAVPNTYDLQSTNASVSAISDTESYKIFRNDLERDIIRYYRKHKKVCHNCGGVC